MSADKITPRTDAILLKHGPNGIALIHWWRAMKEHARQLERELSAAKAALDVAMRERNDAMQAALEEVEQLKRARDLLVMALHRATGQPKERIAEAPTSVAVEHAKQIVRAESALADAERGAERLKVHAEALNGALANLFALVNGEVPSLLEDDHHYELVSNALAAYRAYMGKE